MELNSLVIDLLLLQSSSGQVKDTFSGDTMKITSLF